MKEKNERRILKKVVTCIFQRLEYHKHFRWVPVSRNRDEVAETRKGVLPALPLALPLRAVAGHPTHTRAAAATASLKTWFCAVRWPEMTHAGCLPQPRRTASTARPEFNATRHKQKKNMLVQS